MFGERSRAARWARYTSIAGYRPTVIVEHRPRLGISHRHPHKLDTHLAPSVHDHAPGHGNERRDLIADRTRGADARYISYIDDTTRENMSPTHHNTPVGYVDHTPQTHSG